MGATLFFGGYGWVENIHKFFDSWYIYLARTIAYHTFTFYCKRIGSRNPPCLYVNKVRICNLFSNDGEVW